LTGTKVGCTSEQCGACAVLVDGQATLSCVRAASEFTGREIVTVEGLSDGATLSSVQQVFVDEGAAQCGFCTPGIVIATTALLNNNAHPTKVDIQKALYPHLCRCGSQGRVLAAIHRLIKGR
jgi:aerobic-type carbon monoxide dehydrogenase small subunit (CoxS/CutS family)